MEDHYTSDRALSEYLLFHYGSAEDSLPWRFGPHSALGFPVRCVEETLDVDQISPRARALDVGCAVGRTTFALSTRCREAVGIDSSEVFISAAQRLAAGEDLPFRVMETGTRYHSAIARAPEDAHPERVRFEVGDATSLRADLGEFDIVLACNLLCRLAKPQLFLERLPSLVVPGGQLVITTPNTWLETFTAREHWLGATPHTGEPLEALRKVLEPSFALRRRLDLPFLIREHHRKYQWSVAEATVWQRRQ